MTVITDQSKMIHEREIIDYVVAASADALLAFTVH